MEAGVQGSLGLAAEGSQALLSREQVAIATELRWFQIQ